MPTLASVMYYPLIDLLKPNLQQPIRPSEKLDYATLRERARKLTVKVNVGKSNGSGILIGRKQQQQEYVYTVATNAHVVRPDKVYKIATHDNKLYPANLHQAIHGKSQNLNHNLFKGNDLAILQFRSREIYPVASLAQSIPFPIGAEVYAAGFPFDLNTGLSNQFRFLPGMVVLRTGQPINRGYQLAYTIDVKKGMSGGPLLNRAGQVIGINGMGAYPLNNNVYNLPDGTKPCKSLLPIMQESSFAIPIDTLMGLASTTLKINYAPVMQDISPRIGVVLENGKYDLRSWEEQRKNRDTSVAKLRLQQRVSKAMANCGLFWEDVLLKSLTIYYFHQLTLAGIHIN